MLNNLIHSFLLWGKMSGVEGRKTSSGRRTWRARLCLEQLESREVPAVFLVTTGADSGPGSLREAILEANTTGEMDTINIDATVGTISLDTELPEISTSMEINGPSPTAQTSISPTVTGSFRIFTIPFNGNTVALSNLFITGGGADDGGAVWSFADLTVSFCTFMGNTATNNGGAIFQMLAPLSVISSTITLNAAGNDGGGISFQSGGVQPLTVAFSTFLINTAGSDGGAIFYEGRGTVTIDGFSGFFFSNTALTGRGGAVCCDECDDLIVTEVPVATLQSNAAGATGGAIFANAWRTVSINAAVSGNTAGDPLTNGLHLLVRPNTTVFISPLVTDSFLVQIA